MTGQAAHPAVQIRRATAADQRTIRTLVQAARLDPFDLRWVNFVVADLGGEIVGIGQIRSSPRCRELGSLLVREGLRGQGIGRRIIETLLADEPGDVYLECRAEMVPYYERFGFRVIPWQQAPPPLRFKASLMTALAALAGMKGAVMVRRAAEIRG